MISVNSLIGMGMSDMLQSVWIDFVSCWEHGWIFLDGTFDRNRLLSSTFDG